MTTTTPARVEPSPQADMSLNKPPPPRKAHPLLWVPSGYFAEGTAWAVVTNISNTVYFNMTGNKELGMFLASWLGFPYSVKPLWGPFLELVPRKRSIVIPMQAIIAVCFGLAAFALGLPSFVAVTFALFMLAGLAGATQDMATDGIYVTSLDSKEQPRYSGFQSMFWTLGPIFATGVLVYLSGKLYERSKSWPVAWGAVLGAIAVLYAVFVVHHSRNMPPGDSEGPRKTARQALQLFVEATTTFFQKRGILRMILFAYLYRFAVGMLDKMMTPFILSPRAEGGLGLDNSQLGLITGVFGNIGFFAASILGGWVVAKYGLGRKVLLLLCLAVNIPNLTFVFLSQTLPTNFWLVSAVVTVEKFGFGFGAVGHMVYMMQQIAPGKFRTAHYAFATGFMGLCYQTTGIFASYLTRKDFWNLNFQQFFLVVMIAGIPSLIAAAIAPFYVKTDEEPAAAGGH